ncbi:hypothetical protein [Magnetococcus marinus]|uniref:hypothetical protein n=1 Tax=Magnetococcus marinus TaxID=1124597 RepID=UPI0002DC11EC|nr:hypothetical protein [Magnetococcus marinus]
MPAETPDTIARRREGIKKAAKLIGLAVVVGLSFKFLLARFLASTRFRPKHPPV